MIVARYPNYVGEKLLSVDDSEAKHGSALHRDLSTVARSYFAKAGWQFTDTHIGINGHEDVYAFADFAMERRGRIVLVECLTHWTGTKKVIEKKLKLNRFAPIWFVAQPRSSRTLRARGYNFVPLPPLDKSAHGRNHRAYVARTRLR